MRFAIASLDYWHHLGYDTTIWRKSTDGTQAMCHDSFAVLAEKDKVQIYDATSAEFKALLASDEWSSQEYVEVE